MLRRSRARVRFDAVCTAFGERALQRVVDELVDRTRLAKAHLDLGWVHIHIDARRVELKKKDIRRMAAAVQDVGIGFAHCMGEQLVTHETAIDEEELRVAARPRVGGQ